jgi:hypothetical protein
MAAAVANALEAVIHESSLLVSSFIRLFGGWHNFNLPLKGLLRRGDSRHLAACIPKSQTGILHDTLPHESLDLGSTCDSLISVVPLV